MIISINTDSQVVTTTCSDGTATAELPLYSRAAFELLSREWVRVGWALRYYHTFKWFGRPVLQLPEDLVRLQEAIYLLRPDIIIETGVFRGGSLLFGASLCEALGNGRVIGIDKDMDEGTRKSLASHRLAGRISLIEGDSVATSTMNSVRALIPEGHSVMVILDSNHSADHVMHELECYAPLVTPGFCMLAEDGIMRDLADVPGGESDWTENNPATAARQFLGAHPEFEMRQPGFHTDDSELRQPVTYWPDGWLWKKELVG